MGSLLFDSRLCDEDRRGHLYAGQLFVFSPVRSSLALVDLARELLAEAFTGRDPRQAQFEIAVEDYAKLLAVLKPKFIHHPRAKECIKGILREIGCDPQRTYFDVPRMRTATAENYLTSGIAYAFHPHRDTWYSAPMCQINWWLPIYEIEPTNSMAFHPFYFSHPVRNGSRHYNYQEWNRTSRYIAAQQIGEDKRQQPKPEEPIALDPQTRVLPPVGGMILFSGAQLHSTVPNESGKTRFSIDFRTVHYGDVVARRGARNVDSECTGTSLRDFLRATDLARIQEEICLAYDAGPPRPVGWETAVSSAVSSSP